MDCVIQHLVAENAGLHSKHQTKKMELANVQEKLTDLVIYMCLALKARLNRFGTKIQHISEFIPIQ